MREYMGIQKLNLSVVRTRCIILLSGLLVFGLTANVQGQSKKELRFRVSTLESQIGQLRNQTKAAQLKAKKLQDRLDKQKLLKDVESELYCDSVIRVNEKLKSEILLLKNQLYHKKLANGMDSLHPRLKKAQHYEKLPQERRDMMAEYQKNYLTNCFRLKASHRLFSEQIIVEYELNPMSTSFEGYVRHQYIPDMGADEYNFQRISGHYEFVEKGTLKLTVTSLDKKLVNIVFLHNVKREIYNGLDGEPEDLKKIRTKVVAIEQFYFSTCAV